MSDVPEISPQALDTDDDGVTPPPAPPSDGGGAERPNGTINIADEMRSSYRDYSMSVIVGRALPDVRDGLKPVHRRILYAMFDEGLLSNRKYSKCAGVVGEVLKKYHPHGDSAVYDALVRMAQPWNMGAPLIDGQGNFGSGDGDPAAAYRYTESRLTRLAEELLRDIEKRTVDFVPNFDGTTGEPAVLPSRIPNLLVNGSEGIAVAMATRCPPHNLGEVIDALLAIIAERYDGGPVVDTRRLMELMPGPDFPTGGIICGRAGIASAYETGRGSIKVRGKARIEDNERTNKTQIIIDEIPYQVNKARLVERIAELVREKKIEGISELRDESDRTGMRIAIDLRRDAVAEVVLNGLYKHTPLQTTFPTHMLAIVDGQPRTLPMRELLENFVDFRREVVTRRTRFELDEAEKRFHIVAGLVVALDDIDRIIEIIRSSRDTDEAKARLCAERFVNATKLSLFANAPTPQTRQWLAQGFAQIDEVQAQAILEMRLSRLVGLERDKLLEEGEELLQTIARLNEILSDLAVLMGVIKDELVDVKTRFATPRRTEVADDVDDLSLEDLIAEEEMVVTISGAGYIKRSALSGYRAQRRGGKGRSAAKTKEDDFVADAFVASTHSYLLTFTNRGRVFWVKVHQLPEAGPQARGRPLVNLIPLEEGEQVASILPVREFPTEVNQEYVVTCTRQGTVKKTDLTQYANPRSSGLIACGIEEGDELISVKITDGRSDLLLSTADGMSVRFAEIDVRPMGRAAVGVKGLTLRDGDTVVSMERVTDGARVLTVTERGYGKRTDIAEYPRQRRGGQGVITIKTIDRNGPVAAAIQVLENDEVMVTTDRGTLIRLKAQDVSEYGRNTQGVRILHVAEGERVISLTRIAEPADDDEETGLTAQDTEATPGDDADLA
ncbi:MAG: DNA gyrase subunit A [Myxococcota bacterium]